MRIRYVLILGALGVLGAGYFQSVLLLYVDVFCCCLLYALRRIESQVGDLGRQIPKLTGRDVLLASAHLLPSSYLIRHARDEFEGKPLVPEPAHAREDQEAAIPWHASDAAHAIVPHRGPVARPEPTRRA